ncbi:metallophosphoesterase family protein [Candidatus Woesearchaeota archaeon]|nr:metallophosphoesterase family protein [Candidatus Woesearchaeota archaeon]
MRTAILADIHGNIEALQAVVMHAKTQRITGFLVAGDMVGYGANPNEVLQLLQEIKAVMILGDHDKYSTNSEDIRLFNEYAQKAMLYTRNALTPKNKELLNSLKETYEQVIEGRKVFMVHGSVNDHLKEYVHATTPDNVFSAMLKQAKADILIMGHTHQPFVRRIMGKLIINPGSVGQPRDYTPKSDYCILDTQYMQATIQKVSYDIGKAANKIVAAGLPRYLGDRLFQGR